MISDPLGNPSLPSLFTFRYISRSKDLAMDFFDVMRQASMDDGLSVRKRAIKVGRCEAWEV